MTYDTSRLAKLGKEHKRRRAALDEIRDQLAPEIVQADQAGIQQREIAELSGYTREAVRQLCLTDEQREAEKVRRRERTRKVPTS